MKVRLLNTSKKNAFLLCQRYSFLKLSKTVTEYEFITKYSTKLIMNETKFIVVFKSYISLVEINAKSFHFGG